MGTRTLQSLWACAWLLGLTLGGKASAETYTVGPGGSGLGDGTEANPWATLQTAADRVLPGDQVMVAPGNYAGFVLRTSGAPSAPIRFVAQPGVIIDQDSEEDGAGVHLANVSFVSIVGFAIHGVSGRGIAHRGATAVAPSSNLEIRGNTIIDAGREGMYLSQVADSEVVANVIRGSGQSGADRTHGIYLANGGSDRTVLAYNEIAQSGTAGIHFNGDLSIGGDGIISDLKVIGNVIYDNGQNGLNMDGVQDSLIENNVIYGNAGNGIRAYAIDAAEGPSGLHIVNNTIVATDAGGWCVRVTAVGDGIVIFNNLLISEAGPGGSIAIEGTDGVASDYNGLTNRFTPDRDDRYLMLTGWQALGFDTHSIIVEDISTTLNVSDLVPPSGAASLDRGTATFAGVAAATTDQRGYARPVGNRHDLGAHEYCAGSECTEPGPGPPNDSSGNIAATGGQPSVATGGAGAPFGGQVRVTGGVMTPVGGGTVTTSGGQPAASGGGGLEAGANNQPGDGGCGCSVPGTASPSSTWWTATAVALGLTIRSRRRRG